MAAVRRNDERAFGELYSRYGRRVFSYVFGMVGDHGRAEDIAQEVFISALRRMRASERPIAFKPWIYEIARNACIDEFRRARRATEVPLDPDVDDERRALHQPPAPSHAPDAALERRQALDDLRGAFRGLSDNHHKILVLRELEGLSYSEIGRRMGISRAIVESTLFRARRKLSEEYDEIATGRRCEQVQAVIDSGGSKAVRSLGLRERRRLARHVSHCQPCRRYARMAGVEDSVLRPPTLVEKIAALLPLPAFLRFRGATGGQRAVTASSPHAVSSMRSVQTVAELVDPSSPATVLGRAAAALAAVTLAGGGVVVAVGSNGQGGHSQPRAGISADRASSGAALTAASGSGSRQGLATRAAAGAGTAAAGAPRSGAISAGSGADGGAAAQPTPSGGGAQPSQDAGIVASSPGAGAGQSGATAEPARLPRAPSGPPLGLPPLPPLGGVQLPGLPVNPPQVSLPSGPVQTVLNSLPGVVGSVTGSLAIVNAQLGGSGALGRR